MNQLFFSNCSGSSSQLFIFEEISCRYLEAKPPKVAKQLTRNYDERKKCSLPFQHHNKITSKNVHCLSISVPIFLIPKPCKAQTTRHRFPMQNFEYPNGDLKLLGTSKCVLLNSTQFFLKFS